MTALFFLSLRFYFLLFVFVCLSVHLLVCVCVCLSVCLSVSLPVCRSFYLCVCLSMCLCVCMSVCVSVCLYVIMYYVYMYVVFIVINVCKLLHVRRPTSSPRAVWNPCKINKALNIYSDTRVCKGLLHQARILVCYKSTRHVYRLGAAPMGL